MSERHQDVPPLVQANRLAVTFYTPLGTVRAVRDASFEVRRSEVLGVVGESGCGKSTVAFAIMGYLQGTTRVDGDIHFEGKNVLNLSASELRKLRGQVITKLRGLIEASATGQMKDRQLESFARVFGMTDLVDHKNILTDFIDANRLSVAKP